ncbi:MAG: invasion associated locus B family protein [Gammaproteobacteria bacterium]|nr:MAG: invasion associated locus B family protein [Gammaproteobacteria bacterium]
MNTHGTVPAGHSAARRLLLAIVVGVSVATTAVAAEKSLGTFKAWSALSFDEDKKTVCMIWSQPEKAKGKYKKRGEIFVFVTHRPGDQEMNKVSFETGYTFKESSEVQVTIDGRAYALYTDGSTAWSYDTKDDARMVKAMRAGRTMIVEGTSGRGTRTRDTYSLIGFTAAHNAINKACKAK